jgi:hypothetical protein
LTQSTTPSSPPHAVHRSSSLPPIRIVLPSLLCQHRLRYLMVAAGTALIVTPYDSEMSYA